jgi:hypothetical protein
MHVRVRVRVRVLVQQTRAPLSATELRGGAGDEGLQPLHHVSAPQHQPRRHTRSRRRVRVGVGVGRPAGPGVPRGRHADQSPVQPEGPPRCLGHAHGRLPDGPRHASHEALAHASGLLQAILRPATGEALAWEIGLRVHPHA